ncbi:MAG: FAD-dependent oxidoreductase [Syntrophobacteraceae bacterium]|nr:FAD-dependent oxidoreductase [Syntrophobacteraceae bacterium]
MKAPKDRLHRVLVIGATPSGLAATNKLGEMGIPVVLVDSDPDLHVKLAREDWRLPSGLTLNYALRPGLLRILRNPRIRCILPGEVKALKHTPQGFSARIEHLPAFVDPERCTLCGLCARICPVTSIGGLKPIQYHGRQSLPGRPVIDKRRQPLCQANCPLGVNVQGYMALAREGRYREALDLIRRDNVLPGICGRVCSHPCESACRRGELDEPLAIRDIKRFLADYAPAGSEEMAEPAAPTRPERVAVVGSGPAGLAAAADLARFGYSVTVFEKEDSPGGLLRYGIGPHRLPREVLDREIRYLESLGIVFRTNHPVDPRKDLIELQKQFQAILLTTGVRTDRKLGVPGEDLDGVSGCLETLLRFHRGQGESLGQNVAVIGDGNAAFDLARGLARTGRTVTLLSWFPEDMIPADREELFEAREEGVRVVDRTQVIAFEGTEGTKGKLQSLRCVRTQPGPPDSRGIPWPVPVPGEEPFDLVFEFAVIAVGQQGDRFSLGEDQPVLMTDAGYIAVDSRFRTNLPGVFAGGDVIRGPSSVVEAMASGRAVARAIHEELSGEKLSVSSPWRPQEKEFPSIPADLPFLARGKMPKRQVSARMGSHIEVAMGLDESQALSEASRCLQCGVCSECLQCAEVCSAIGAIHHEQAPVEEMEQVGVVIVADPEAAPSVKGEDVIRAYSTKSAKDDSPAMMLRGFAAAAEALVLLGSGAQRLKGQGLSFSPPDPILSDDIRMGVFVCRCNDSLGWIPEMEEYVTGLVERPQVEHAETLVSACTPEGSAAIVRVIRERGLTRAVLASCVCCPLDFVCSACTDQRTRLKFSLFHGTGIGRAMVETCNVRGEALRFLQVDQSLAMERFKGLIDRSIGRARRLKALPAPARPYNFTTAVLGESEAAVKSALTLAEMGMDVFYFGTPQEDASSQELRHPGIHCFPKAAVKGIRGTLGDFGIIAEVDGVEQTYRVGVVILGENARKRVPYLPEADLPPRIVPAAMQRKGVTGVPFFYPGSTPIQGIFLAKPREIRVSDRIKGAAAAVLAASVMPRRPRQSKGYTVVVNEELCRGCGRCVQVCPYQAIGFRRKGNSDWCAVVDEALCKGCGNCVSVCPSNAADSPYRNRGYLEEMVEEILL